MSDSPVLKKVQGMLNEEKWTRATLSAYSINQFKELDSLVAEAKEERIFDDLKSACDEHLGHAKTSIIALYISSMISLERQTVDDSTMITLINIFSDNKRWNLVEYLCERILSFGEDRNALRTLADCYRNEDREADVWEIYERLVKVDFEEAEIVKLLAERKEAAGDTEEALKYYRKALHRFIAKKSFSSVKEVWGKLLEMSPGDIDFFLHVQKKIAKSFSPEKAATLLMDLYRIYRQRSDLDTSILIIKTIIDYDEKDPTVRREITECYREKYAEHSHLEEYIKLSALSSGPRNIHEAIADFEKHISFDAGNFIFHRNWGVGRIASVEGDDIVIDFAKNRGHRMSLKMAVGSLTTLSKEHIWVLKSVWKKDKLHDKVKTDPEWALKTIIRSFDNRADLKRIKAELVPSVLSASEWNGWSAKARDILKENPAFGNASDSIDTFIVRDRKMSNEEKIYYQFKAEKNFFERVQYMRDFLKYAEADSEFFKEMFEFFSSYLKVSGSANELVVSSFIFINSLIRKYNFVKFTLPYPFHELMDKVESIEAVYDGIRDAEIRKSFLVMVKDILPDWPDIYVRLFPYSLNMSLIDDLIGSGHQGRVREMALRIIENYRENREAFLWLVRNAEEKDWFKSLNLPFEKILITLIHILDISYKDIENHRNATSNRKVARQIEGILFKDKVLQDFIADTDRTTITRIITLVEDVKGLDPAIKHGLRKLISERFPDFHFYGVEEKHTVSRGLLVTAAKYEEKQKLLSHILDVEVPNNSKEIAAAIQLGDLRENAEYKAAKEKQEILNSTVAKLKNEIERAQIFDKSTVNTSRVSFGTKVKLLNESTSAEEEYCILGPWESDPANSIISYLSPFGSALISSKPGQSLTFTINENEYKYKVLQIQAAEF